MKSSVTRCHKRFCNNDHDNYFNHATRRYYCSPCAEKINNENSIDSMRLYGHSLCTYEVDKDGEGVATYTRVKISKISKIWEAPWGAYIDLSMVLEISALREDASDAGFEITYQLRDATTWVGSGEYSADYQKSNRDMEKEKTTIKDGHKAIVAVWTDYKEKT